ncbi:calcium/sodium antiporter [Rapidithrix thailandica]|uniref:Calcium/sodium antiporter n=1 Tax=Rapidithrix thailandica TaxID=413964 RepID=A0AAW9RNC6_9BACT
MIQYLLWLVFGLALLVKGADWFVNGAAALARKHKVSELTIGLTIIAFGTSAPELVVNAFAAADHYPGIVFGNILGSNNFNLFIILGIAGLFSPIVVQSSTVWKEIPFSLFAVFLLFLLVNDALLFSQGENLLTRPDSLLLLACFAGFLVYVYKQLKKEQAHNGTEIIEEIKAWKVIALILVGLTSLIFGGKLVVDNAIEIARKFELGEELIGLTIVAAGTSLPELATTLVATFKKKTDLAVGNVIGSNIFNIFFILPLSALIQPLAFDLPLNHSLYLLAGGTLFLFVAMFTGGKRKLDRWEAALLLLVYGIYAVYLFG